jgi:hypothetical protein
MEQNYTTMEREALRRVYTCHKFCHYLFSNKFVFYMDHMALTYLLKMLQMSNRITRWLLLFLEYDYTVMYKLAHTHFVADALSWFLHTTKPPRVPDMMVDAPPFIL